MSMQHAQYMLLFLVLVVIRPVSHFTELHALYSSRPFLCALGWAHFYDQWVSYLGGSLSHMTNGQSTITHTQNTLHMDTAYSKVFPVHKGELWEVSGECLEVFYLHHDMAMVRLSCLVWQRAVLLQPEITLGRWVHHVKPLPLGSFPLPTREGSWAWDCVQPLYTAVYSFSARRSLSMKLYLNFVLRAISSFHMRIWALWG